MFIIPEYIYIDFWILSFLSCFSSDPILTVHLSSPIQAVVEIFCTILWITIHEISVSHLMFSPGLYWPDEGMYTFCSSNNISVYTLQIQWSGEQEWVSPSRWAQ